MSLASDRAAAPAAAAAGALVDDGQKVLLGTLQIADGLEGRGGEVRRRHVTIIRPAPLTRARGDTDMPMTEVAGVLQANSDLGAIASALYSAY